MGSEIASALREINKKLDRLYQVDPIPLPVSTPVAVDPMPLPYPSSPLNKNDVAKIRVKQLENTINVLKGQIGVLKLELDMLKNKS